jgi:two-component system response regulator FixJ
VILNRVVHIVDSDAGNRRSLARTLRHEGMDSFAYASGDDLLEASGYILPGCVLIIARPPQPDQSDMVRTLLAARPEMAVIVMGAEPTIALWSSALRAGAVDFLDLARPLAKLRVALDYAFDILPEKVAHQRFIGEAIALKSRLTPREQDVLKGIVAGHTNRAIAQALGIGTRTVEMHRSNIMQKLHMDNIAELIRFAVLSGIAEPGATDPGANAA